MDIAPATPVERRPLSQAVVTQDEKTRQIKAFILLMQSDYFTYFTSSINPLKDPAASEDNHIIADFDHSLASESHKFECPPIKYCDFKGPIKSRNNMKFRQLFGLTTRAAQTNDSTQQQTKGKNKKQITLKLSCAHFIYSVIM